MRTNILACLTFLLGMISVGGIAYYMLALVAVRRLQRQNRLCAFFQVDHPPLTLLKPLCGIDPELKRNLETFFLQDYPSFEVLFAVKNESDPAVALVHELAKRHPKVPCSLIVVGESLFPNAKVFSLQQMASIAKYDILVVTDSDVSVTDKYLTAIAGHFESKEVGLVTNLYRGIGGRDFWSKLEALGMSTEFMGGVVTANFLEGMKFSLGPSMAISRECLKAIGGFESLSDYLADDFVLGEKTIAAGYKVILSTHAVEHHAYSTGFRDSFKHRLRWNRSSRFSRPAGYVGQGFTYGLPLAILLCLVAQTGWSIFLLACSGLVRGWLAYALGRQLLADLAVLPRLWMIPLQDCISFAAWIGGFLGKEVVWRNIRYQIVAGGRFVRMAHTNSKTTKE